MIRDSSLGARCERELHELLTADQTIMFPHGNGWTAHWAVVLYVFQVMQCSAGGFIRKIRRPEDPSPVSNTVLVTLVMTGMET